MTIERFILIAVSVISFISIFYMPKTKYRVALVSLIAFQATTWAAINILVQMGSISFPVRTFTKASQVGFLQNFILYPMIFVWYVILYPVKSSSIAKFLHFLIFTSAVVWFIYFAGVYTGLQDFVKGTKSSQLIRLYLNFLFQFGICHFYVKWFCKKCTPVIGSEMKCL